jgi:hypothetical protein
LDRVARDPARGCITWAVAFIALLGGIVGVLGTVSGDPCDGRRGIGVYLSAGFLGVATLLLGSQLGWRRWVVFAIAAGVAVVVGFALVVVAVLRWAEQCSR